MPIEDMDLTAEIQYLQSTSTRMHDGEAFRWHEEPCQYAVEAIV